MTRRFHSFAVLLPLLLLTGLALRPAAVRAQDEESEPRMASYYEQSDLLAAPASTFREGLIGLHNPALPALAGSNLAFAWTANELEPARVEDWAALASAGGFSAGLVERTRGPNTTLRYHLGLAGGSGRGSVGIGYQWYTGDATALGRFNRVTLGTVLRPVRYLSIGVTGNISTENNERDVVGALGVRPLGTARLTLFADAAWEDDLDALADLPWSAGASVEVVRGVDLVGRVFDSEAFTAGLRVELGRLGLDSQSRVTPSGDYDGQIHRVRLGAHAPSALGDAVQAGRKRLEVDANDLPYRRPGIAALLGEDDSRFYPVLRSLNEAADSDRIRTVALDLADFQATPEQAWEVRQAIRRVQARGKRVVAFVREPGITTYHVASQADVVALDPQGLLTLPGYALSRTFLDGTLDKLGLEFQEWRFFEYKSAVETLSRTEFSDADREQRQAYVDDLYETFRQDVAASRNLSPDSLDRIIDDRLVLSASDARRVGLADTLARWHERDDLLEAVTGDATDALDRGRLREIADASRRWGARPEIAVVYGIGGTQLDEGIEARELSKTIRSLGENDDVAAIVFRVDSPGGSAQASDLVAEAIQEAKANKPVIVSQGQVAASGGYWISMYADEILAGPTTVTGSIGVIGGWLYDDGFSDKTGLSYDVVQRGERADLFTGYQLPLPGAPELPTRPLSDEGLARVEDLFQEAYTTFVQKVATGRDTTEAHVREIGEGRIYSGLDGQQVGLVDRIGGLLDAIDRAREVAGLQDTDVRVREVNPEQGFLDLSALLPGPLQALLPSDPGEPAMRDDPVATFVRFVAAHQPQPLVLLVPGMYPHMQR
jgi:protease-4